jgi:DNA-directed RNA polymerase subunit H (RpoH/RPB5)
MSEQEEYEQYEEEYQSEYEEEGEEGEEEQHQEHKDYELVNEDQWYDWPDEEREYEYDFQIVRPGNFNIFDIKKTQIEMMEDRGYLISDEERSILSMNVQQFQNYQVGLAEEYQKDNLYTEWLDVIRDYGRNMTWYGLTRLVLGNIYYKPNEDGSANVDKKCFLIYITPSDEEKHSISNTIIGSIINMIDVNKQDITYRRSFEELVIITTDTLSSKAAEDLERLYFTKKWLFLDKELIFNVSRHFMVPEHGVLNKEKKLEFKKRFKAPQQISSKDPVVKYYGWDVGEIVMIKRDIENMGMFVPEMINKRIIVRDASIS